MENSQENLFMGGGLEIVPELEMSFPALGAPLSFRAPATIDHRDYCTPTENQGQTSMCAAYTAAGFAEATLWKRNHYPVQIDPSPVFKWAQENDGLDGSYGTTLNAAAQALVALNILPNGKGRAIGKDPNELKFAIHKGDVCFGGFMVTDEWSKTGKDGVIPTLPQWKSGGGHAVLMCGYNRDGVWFQNSWGVNWGLYGFGFMTWKMFSEKWLYGFTLD